ncbi:MAG: ATPase V, partial [Nitrosopumilaceae archaeon]
MASLSRRAVLLQKRKQQASKLRRQGEREYLKNKSIANRSISGLVSLQRRIDSSKEQLEDVSGILTQKMAQQESINRLITNAQESLRREIEAKEQADHEVSFADSDEEKQQATARLRIITDRIAELEDEIKQRTKTAKKISQGIEDYKKSSTKLTAKIKKQTHSKPNLQKLIKTSRKATMKLSKQIKNKAKQEKSAKLNLSKISKKLSSKKRKTSRKIKSKARKIKSKARKIKSK